jgi:hypothetical protein
MGIEIVESTKTEMGLNFLMASILFPHVLLKLSLSMHCLPLFMCLSQIFLASVSQSAF